MQRQTAALFGAVVGLLALQGAAAQAAPAPGGAVSDGQGGFTSSAIYFIAQQANFSRFYGLAASGYRVANVLSEAVNATVLVPTNAAFNDLSARLATAAGLNDTAAAATAAADALQDVLLRHVLAYPIDFYNNQTLALAVDGNNTVANTTLAPAGALPLNDLLAFGRTPNNLYRDTRDGTFLISAERADAQYPAAGYLPGYNVPVPIPRAPAAVLTVRRQAAAGGPVQTGTVYIYALDRVIVPATVMVPLPLVAAVRQQAQAQAAALAASSSAQG